MADSPTSPPDRLPGDRFELVAPYEPAGDQPQAIDKLVAGFAAGLARQTLLGVTGPSKTSTLANVIQQVQKPPLGLAHNNTPAATLSGQYNALFPNPRLKYYLRP